MLIYTYQGEGYIPSIYIIQLLWMYVYIATCSFISTNTPHGVKCVIDINMVYVGYSNYTCMPYI